MRKTPRRKRNCLYAGAFMALRKNNKWQMTYSLIGNVNAVSKRERDDARC